MATSKPISVWRAFLVLLCGLQWAGLVHAESSVQLLPDATRDGMQNVKLWAHKHTQTGVEEFSKSHFSRMDSPDFWGDQIIYQIQIDRFNNGDLSNDSLNLEANQVREMQSGNLYSILDYRHGGDLEGIRQRLDYIKDLGITALWITPPLKNNGSYHGYCTTDFTQIDPGFGSTDKLRQLVKEAHERGIRVILDIVVNHMCDNQTKYSRPPDHYKCVNELDAKNWSGEPGGSTGQGELAFSDNFFPPFKSQYFFNRCGANSREDMMGTGPAAVYGDFVSTMFDFDTRNFDFQEIFTELQKYWIASVDVDGLRLDAAKHVTEDFLAYFSTEMRTYARSLGKKNFFLIGEVAGPSDWIGRRLGRMFSNPVDPNDHGVVPATLTKRMLMLKDTYLSNPWASYPGLNAVYDFSHGGTAVDVLQNARPPQALADFFQSTYYNDLSAQQDYRFNWNLLEIHDWPRFASRSINSMGKSILGASYLAFAEETPIIYYGYEQGFNGDCHFDNISAGLAGDSVRAQCKSSSDGLKRQDMFQGGMLRLGSTVPQINELAYIGVAKDTQAVTWEQDPYLNRGHELYRSARKFLRLRSSCNALRAGQTKFRWAERNQNGGLLAFSRIDPVAKFEALVLLNTANEALQIPEIQVDDFAPGHRWVNLLNTAEWGTSYDQSGNLRFGGTWLKGNSVMVLVPEVNVGAFDPALGTNLCVR